MKKIEDTVTTQTKTGYLPIYRTGEYGGRTIITASVNPILYEDKEECRDDNECDNNFVAVATVTWEENVPKP